MRDSLRRVLDYIKDAVFPTYCVGCREEGTWLCDACIQNIPQTGVFLCPLCHESSDFGACCDACAPYSYLDSHIAIVPYIHGSVVGTLIEALKYNFATEVLACIAKMSTPVLNAKRSLLSNCDIIVPIPLYSKRFAERGFNQAASIGSIVSDAIGVPVLSILYRKKYTRQQALLQKEERAENMKAAFTVVSHEVYDVSGKDIILVDDVYTTGSTMQEAAHVLKAAGAASVVGVSIARG